MEYQQFDCNQILSYCEDEEADRVGPSWSNTSSETILFRLDEVDEICRICLSPGTIPIFGGDRNIISDLKQSAGIDVTLDDGLPHNLCTQCQKQLESAITFRRLAQNSNRILKKTDGVDNESEKRQCASSKIGDDNDGNSEIGVYLEYSEGESGSVDSDVEESKVSFKDTSSISDGTEPDHEELKAFIKNARFPQCEVCNIIFRTAEQLNEHSSGHDPRSIVICEVCQNIIHKQLYSIHLKLHKKSFSQRLEKKHRKIECTVCGKNIGKNYMKRHMKLHGVDEAEERFKKCTICDKHIHRDYLTEHIIRMHMQPKEPQEKSIQKVKCPICSQMYSESTYKNHVASHATSRKKYFCEECGKEFHLPSSFATHKLTHKAEYKYKCQFCPYRGKHLGLLKVHVRTHTRDYAYKCKICDANFITKSNLSAHEKTHSAEVKFICAECGKCFAAKRTLRNHMISVHEGIRAFSCDICGKSYGCRQGMLSHKKRVHDVFFVSSVGKTPSYLLEAQNFKI